MRWLHPFLALAFVLAVLLACGSKPPAQSPEAQFKGTIPVVVVNATNAPICRVTIEAEYKSVYLLDGSETYVEGSGRQRCLDPASTTQYTLLAGKYELSVKGKGYSDVVYRTPMEIKEPTELVVYDTVPSTTAAAPAGMKRLAIQSEQSKRARAADQAQVSSAQARKQCLANMPPENERPSPGKAKITGKWKCVLGGAYKGTDNVDLVQLSDGRISATVSGSDRNATWTGAVVHDEVHFRFGDAYASGGVLKVDATGRAMLGNCWTFSQAGTCEAWTFTCTR